MLERYMLLSRVCAVWMLRKLDLSAVGIAQLAHAADECILCHAALPKLLWGGLVIIVAEYCPAGAEPLLDIPVSL